MLRCFLADTDFNSRDGSRGVAPGGATTGGDLIWLNGPSSSGKTSLGEALREDTGATYLLTGFDHFFAMLPLRYWGREDGVRFAFSPTGEIEAIAFGSVVTGFITGMCHATAALVRLGHNVIVETGFTADGLRACRPVWEPLRPLMVDVYCPLDVLVERESARGNRPRGLARSQFYTIPRGIYLSSVGKPLMIISR